MKEKYINTKYGKVFLRIDNEKCKDRTLFMLHGFGMDLSTYNSLVNKIKNIQIIRFDFLGFGKSSDPVKPIGVKEYSECLHEIIKRYCTGNVYLFGHSFGGRVAIYYASKYGTLEKRSINKMFLVNAKALKNKSFRLKVNILIYKIKRNILKIINKNKYLEYIKDKGSRDYKMLNDVMKKSFVKVVNYDLGKHLKKVKCDTIIIGSINDSEVEYKETLCINKYIKNSKLYPCYRSGHFSYIDEESKVLSILKKEL